ncbi:MAG: SRPBCC family protein [Actinobacteria bacterium]|nr:SRPBCC family protein [Actinomycetota bacterium]
MARVHFTVRRHLPLPARVAFDELVDWRGHAQWVPMTRVVIESGDGGAGTTFVATTGLGPLALPDRMRVESLDATQMTVHIVKIGPVLTGDVRLAVEPVTDDSSDITWDEDVRVPLLPGFLSRPVGAVARKAFEVSIDRMAKRARQRV